MKSPNVRLGINVAIHKHELSLFYETSSKLLEGQFLLHTDDGIYDFEVAMSGDLYAFNFVAPKDSSLSVSLKQVALKLFGEESLIEDFPDIYLTCRQFFFLFLKKNDAEKKRYAAGLQLAIDGISFDHIKTDIVSIESSKLSLETMLVAYGSEELKEKKAKDGASLSDDDKKHNKLFVPILNFLNIAGLEKGFSVGALVKEGNNTFHAITPMKNPPIDDQEDDQHVQGGLTLYAGKDSKKKKLTKLEKWTKLDKKIGPVLLQGIGVRFLAKQQKAQLLLNANLKIAALELELIELGMNIDVKNHFHVSPTISGMGIGISTKAFSLAGAFMKLGESNYAGMLDLKIGDLEISGIGAYQKKNNHKSIFGYALLQYPLGGPPQFFVNGLAAGFGYNRDLLVPKIDKINEFPLIQWAMGDSLPEGDKKTQLEQFPALVKSLDKSIPVKIDQDWVAFGVKFNSFKMVDGFILFMASFGNRFELDLLGQAELNIPEKTKNAVIHIELDLKARFAPDEGVFSLEAALSKDSYILSKDCKMTGGIAYYMWFSGKHKNDFVLSIGGYHPDYKKPSHYPKVQRLGLNWKVSDYVQISGEGYFALTPSCLMAGFKSRLLIHVSAIKVTFSMSVDFLMRWAPFYYELKANIGLSVEFSAKIMFVRVKIRFSLHASLVLSGPDFSGRATIHHPIISFSIKFGAAPKKPKPLDWDVFSNKYLVHEENKSEVHQSSRRVTLSNESLQLLCNYESNDSRKVFHVKPTDGLIEQIVIKAKNGNDQKIWIIDPEYLKIQFTSSVPIKTVSGLMKAPDNYTDELSIRPMSLKSSDFKSSMNISLVKTTSTNRTLDLESYNDSLNERFITKPITENAPSGLWGENINDSELVNSKPIIKDVLKGCEIGMIKPKRSETSENCYPTPLQIDKNGVIDIKKNEYPFGKTTKNDFQSGISKQKDRNSVLEALKKQTAFNYLGNQFEDVDCSIDFDDLEQFRYESPELYDIGSDQKMIKD